MLRNMPKVGDELRCIDKEYSFLTFDKRYIVEGVDEDGDPYVIDNDGDKYIIHPDYDFSKFEIFAETSAKVNRGYFDIDYVIEEGDMIRVGLLVDSDGYATLRDLDDASKNAGKRAELERKIAKLQAELDAL